MEEKDDEDKENLVQRYLVAVGEPIPHPSDIEIIDRYLYWIHDLHETVV
jgi:hypothetical protein